MMLAHYKQCNLELIGRDHVKAGLPCQDKTAYKMADGVRVIALADGAGSKKDSHFGAEIAVNITVDLLSKHFDEYFMMLENAPTRNNKLSKILISEIYDGLNEKAAQIENVSVLEMSSTLLFIAIKGDQYIQGHIGDGLIGELLNNKQGLEVRIRSHPENNGAPNITFFLTDTDASENFRITSGFIGKHIKGYVLMSDGPEEVLFDTVKKTLNPYINNLFSMYKGSSYDLYKQTLLRFLKEKISEYSYDDLSMNFLYIENEPFDYYKAQGPDYIEYLKQKIGLTSRVIKPSSYSYLVDESYQETNVSKSIRTELMKKLNEIR